MLISVIVMGFVRCRHPFVVVPVMRIVRCVLSQLHASVNLQKCSKKKKTVTCDQVLIRRYGSLGLNLTLKTKRYCGFCVLVNDHQEYTIDR